VNFFLCHILSTMMFCPSAWGQEIMDYSVWNCESK
jgi:hypothetical protein